MAQGVKKIKNKLDAIAYNSQFSLNIDPKPIKNRRLETCSYVYEDDIIGRETDLEKILGVLLDSNVQQNVSFLSIVGIGGLGKTALAQLLYNDVRVTTAFPLRLWACVADENQDLLDVKGLLIKILASATGHMVNEGCTMDGLQIQLREKLAGKKFLLVLDDIWTENHNCWHNLTQFLMGGQKGSWIVVTTRSRETARIVGDGLVHDFQGLSKENSWCLFRKVAFGSHLSNIPKDLVKIGEDIVKECANVPLAIRVVGSLLYGQDKQKWLSIQNLGLAQVKESQNSIMSILKLSYHKLESPLKSCFSYCAIFPKDYVIKKNTLIRLWMAHGYIPLNDPQSPEDLGEEYFSILLRRCFLQDVKKDEVGSIRSCKMHDLMHDLAQQVVGKEICRVETVNENVNKKVRHLSHMGNTNISFTHNNQIRSYLRVNVRYRRKKLNADQFLVDAFVGNWKNLRAVDLSWSSIKSLPDSIGELIHLRYVDLSSIKALEVLPESITKLYNLQTLELNYCGNLKELPKDLSKLVNLRVLEIYGCNALRYMPRGIGKLSCLHTLNKFELGSSINDVFDGLEDLKALSNLKGSLEIKIQYIETDETSYEINGGKEGGCLGNNGHLKKLVFGFCNNYGRKEYDEAVMDELQPHSNLMSLEVRSYQGVRMPHWAREDNFTNFLPNLVEINFNHCQKLQYLGQLQLPRLKILKLCCCPNLTGILECPALEELKLSLFNERLKIIPISRGQASSYENGSKLRKVEIDNVAWLKSLPMNSFHDGAKLFIDGDYKVECLGEAMEAFRSCSASLKYLEIRNCFNLKSVVRGGLQHLSALEHLEISNCLGLSLSEVERVSFCQSLHTLKLYSLHRMVKVPNWIQYLSSLQTLHFNSCKSVESMPNWISQLTSLRELELRNCSTQLNERCRKPNGEDWPHIQHIPQISILLF